MGGAAGVGMCGDRKLLAGVSAAALIVACGLSAPASAATYMVGNQTELNNAIRAANADGDASATIKLTGNFAISTAPLANPAKTITIDTQGFTLSGTYNLPTLINSGAVTVSGPYAGTFILSGAVVGANSGPGGNTAGQIGLFANFEASVTNNGSITGGSGGGAGGAGGIGASLLNNATLINNGTISGGTNFGIAAGGTGVQVATSASLVNNGTIQGGNGQGSGGGVGVRLGSVTGIASLVNNGTIRGGSDLTGVATGGTAISAVQRLQPIVNTGTIEGGNGAVAISALTVAGNLTIINSGAIWAGTGQANAMLLASGAGKSNTLELQPGSDIRGNVIANTAGTDDMLRLGGAGSDSFDISHIGTGAQYQNFDRFEKTGSSKWTLTGLDASATNWTVREGTLAVNGTVGGTMDVLAGSRLQGIGQVGTTTSAGTVAPGNSIGTLTISGDYTSHSGALDIESTLGGDASPTDRLVVTGNTAGATTVHVTNLGGSGAMTVEGIKLVDVAGASAGTFALQGDYVFDGDQAAVGGAYAYRLYQNGISTPGDGDWYLRSTMASDPSAPGASAAPLYQPGVPLYEAYPQMLLAFNGLPTLQQRVGDRSWTSDGQAGAGTGTGPFAGIDGAWLRTEGMHGSVEPATSTSATSYDYDLWKLQAGLDGELYQNPAGRLIAGLTAQYGTVSGDVNSLYGNGKIDTTGYGVGATLTWYGETGFYLDAQSQATWYDSDLRSDLFGNEAHGNDGFGYALSLEMGKRFDGIGAWAVTPQAQLIYSSVDFDSFNDRFGARVSSDGSDSLNARLGVALDREESWKAANGLTARGQLYGAANLYSELLDGTSVDVANAGFDSKNDRVSAGLTLGGSYNWNDERFSVYGEVAARSSLANFGDSYAVSGTAGLRIKW